MSSTFDAEQNGQELETDEEKSEDNAGVTDLQDEIRRSGSRAGRGGSLGPQDFDYDGHSIPPTPAEEEVEDDFVAQGVIAEEQTLPPQGGDTEFPLSTPSDAGSSSIRDDTQSVTGSFRSNLSPGPRNPFERRFTARSPSGRPASLRNISGPGFLSSHSRHPSTSSQVTLVSENLDEQEKERPWELIKWTKLKKITSQAYSESAKRAFGQPTALVVSASIVLGTSKGLILVFDYQQVLKQVLGQGTTATECGSITALAMSADHSSIGAGHANGSIFTWDLAQASRPFLHIPPLPFINRVGDGHLYDRAVLHLGFLGTRRTALVSADDSGMAFSHLASRGLGAVRRAVTTTRILGRYPDLKDASRKPSSVLACASLPLGNVEHATDDFGLTAILTPYLLVVVSTTPIAQTQFKSPRSKDVAAHSAMTGCLSWFPSVRTKASAQGSKKTTTPTKLVFCWSNVLSVLEIHPTETDEPGKRAILEFKLRTRWSCDEPILAVQWLSRSVLALLTITQRLLIMEDESMHLSGESDLNPRHIYHRDLFSRQLLPLADKAEQEDSTLHGVVPDAYHMSLRAYKGRLFVLGINDASMGIMSNWADRLTAFMEAGRHIEAIELATSYYSGDGEKQTVGLPVDDASRQVIVKEKLMEMITASLRYIIKATDQDELDVDIRTSFQQLIAPAFAACLVMGELDFLLDNVYEYYSEQSCQDIFLYALEPCILAQKITALPPEMLKDMMTWFASYGLNDRLEELIIELDTSTMDIHQVTNICKNYRLYDAMIHVWNNALQDYITPLIELLELALTPQPMGDAREYNLDQEAAEKMFPYMAYIFTGRSYPEGSYMPLQDANRARSWLYGFIFSTKTVRWPLQHGRIIDFGNKLQMTKTYPYLQCLIAFDCSNFMSMLNEAFEDAFLNGDEEQYANGTASLDLRDFTSGAKFNRQRIVNVLTEVFSDATIPREEKVYFSIFLARNLSKYHQGFILLPESVLKRLIRDLCDCPLEELQAECQLSVEYLLSVYHPPDIQQLIPLYEKAGFSKVLKATLKSERQYGKCLEAYFADKEDQMAVFDCVHDLLRPGHLNARQTKEVTSVIQKHAQQMVQIDAKRAADVLVSSAPDLVEDIIEALAPESYSKYQFLAALFEPVEEHKVRKQFGDLKASHMEQYVLLMCKYSPQHVADYIANSKTSDLRLAELIPTMERSGVVDAAVILMARDGLAKDAMTKLSQHFGTLRTALVGLLSSTPPDEQTNHEAVDDLLDAVEKYSKIGIWLCQSQLRTPDQAHLRKRQRMPVTELKESDLTSSELFWLDLIDVTVDLCRQVSAAAEEGSDDTISEKVSTAVRTVVQSIFTSLLSISSSSARSKHSTPDGNDAPATNHADAEHARDQISFLPILATFLARASTSSPSLSELRKILADIFAAYAFEESMLSLASAFINKDMFQRVEDARRATTKGWRPKSMACEGCKKRVWGPGAGVAIWDDWKRRREVKLRTPGTGSEADADIGKGTSSKDKGKGTVSSVTEDDHDDDNDDDGKKLQASGDAVVSFACGHLFHRRCLEAVSGEQEDVGAEGDSFSCVLCT